ncbi:hypothetical protein [Lentibacillus sp. Marseille-P4043]|nr:hypothetical protein [Lentibacillus sp. Marseille-P4043]
MENIRNGNEKKEGRRGEGRVITYLKTKTHQLSDKKAVSFS